MPHMPIDDLDVYYETHGAGPLLVLVMGLGVDHRAWAPHIAQLQVRFTCLVYDQRGVGLTRLRGQDRRPQPPYTIRGFAQDLAGLIEGVGMGPAHVCGVSMGGTIAMELAASRPELVASLALHATWHRTDPFLRSVFAFREPILRALGPVALQHYVGLWAWAPSHWQRQVGDAVTDTGTLISQDKVEEWSEEDIACYLGHLQAAMDHDCADRLPSIRARTLVTVGTDDILTEQRFADAIAAGIPDAELRILPQAGHAHCFEDVEGFTAMTAAWAAGTADRAGT